MSGDFESSAEAHINSIYSWMEYLMARCPDRYDEEMEGYAKRVLDSFEKFRSSIAQGSLLEPIDRASNDALGRNYAIAQCSVLLLFANSISAICRDQNIPLVASLRDKLWSDLERTYSAFFGSPSGDR